VDVTGLFEQVEGLRERAQQLFHTQLSTNHLILWCLIQVLKKDRHSGWRGRVDERAEKLLVGPEVNVGFATLGPNNDLYAPVIKRAHLLSFAGLVRRIQELGEAVKTGRISAADLQGASLSLTNIGAFGATAGIPFVIPGQVGMLCACAVQERARRAPRPGAPPVLEPRSMLPLLLVFDHRPFNGSHAGTLLKSLKRELENLDLRALLAAEP
jgi:pyruvate/2-oxoglutarate dehydrogenase complex dihydrolipoamide acyltransferase (E2) component